MAMQCECTHVHVHVEMKLHDFVIVRRSTSHENCSCY